VKVEIKGSTGKKSFFDKRFNTGPNNTPTRIRKRISGHPVLLNRVFAKNPIIITAEVIIKTSNMSAKEVPQRSNVNDYRYSLLFMECD
jgi:hypothetical protein